MIRRVSQQMRDVCASPPTILDTQIRTLIFKPIIFTSMEDSRLLIFNVFQKNKNPSGFLPPTPTVALHGAMCPLIIGIY